MEPGIKDDLMVEWAPRANVDYFSHRWTLEEFRSTKRYIFREIQSDSRRRCRLENALWRAWVKANQQLPCFPAANLDWFELNSLDWILMQRDDSVY